MGAERVQRVALFGGSFDPPHRGHVAMAEAAVGACGLDRVVFVPCRESPLKGRRPGASGEERVAMLEGVTSGLGWAEVSDWEINAPIARKGAYRPSPIWLKQTIHPEGSHAITRFELLQRFESKSHPKKRFSLVQANPVTGRMHQIRVHLAHSGHPIVGDKIYGEDEQCYLEFIETGWTEALQRRLLIPRHALHASTLTLTESGFRWKSPLAEDIRSHIISTLVEAEG